MAAGGRSSGSARLHSAQLETFAEKGVDIASAFTITHPGEAIGMVNRAGPVLRWKVWGSRDLNRKPSLSDSIDGRQVGSRHQPERRQLSYAAWVLCQYHLFVQA
jgi:S-methylmethionine-dependent homocysteine/selenocysteine methylase